MGLRVNGIDETKRRLEEAQARARDLTPVLLVAAQDTRTLIDDAFAGGHTPEGQAWAPLSPRTLARRRGGSGNPLIDTARLRNSIQATAQGQALSFGTNVGYAAPQQFGFTRSGTLKRRSYSPRREAGSPWSATVPGRAFLPVNSAGGGYTLMTGGMAGQHWRRVREMVKRYIATGEVT